MDGVTWLVLYFNVLDPCSELKWFQAFIICTLVRTKKRLIYMLQYINDWKCKMIEP